MSETSRQRPLISVVIPTHQRAPLLERSLESLTGQTLPTSQFEVVVVDDGSSDWTASVCSRLAERLTLRYFRIENSGISAAKNLGLFASEAAVVLFFDDDDVADACLLEAHLDAHQAHPEENVAVLGYTTWAPELEVTPVMSYVTDVGQYLFAYRRLEDGQMLDHTYFWGGRSSCKRVFLARHGVFDQDLGGIEDIELGYRLAEHGLKVVHARQAKSFMIRPITFDEFTTRCLKRGRALWRFYARHPVETVDRYCRVSDALEAWPSTAGLVASKVERVQKLERRHVDDGELEENELGELHELYRWNFDAFQAQGIAEAAAEAEGPAPGHTPAPALGGAAICPNPVFIIGSPRSGTSILAWSLAQHSRLWTEAESDIFYYMLKDGNLESAFETATGRPDGTWLANRGVDLEQFLAHVGMGLNALLTSTSGGLRWVDQTPANTLVVERLAAMFPQAQFVHIVRDGRRVVHSMVNFHRTFGDPEAYERMKSSGRLPPWATDFRDACRSWARFAGIASDFCRRHPQRAFTVVNERLITEPASAMGEVLQFLGVPPEPEPADFLRSHRINSSFAASGRSADSPPALSEPWREWTPEQRNAFVEEAGQTMVDCGLVTAKELLEGPGAGRGEGVTRPVAESRAGPPENGRPGAGGTGD